MNTEEDPAVIYYTRIFVLWPPLWEMFERTPPSGRWCFFWPSNRPDWYRP